MGFSKSTKIGLCTGFIALAALLACVPFFAVIDRNYTSLGGESDVGAKYGLLQACVAKDSTENIIRSYRKNTDLESELQCTGVWETDNNLISKAGHVLSDLTSDNVIEDTSTIRWVGWTAVGLWCTTAALSFIIAIMCLYQKSLVWAPVATSIDFVLIAVAFVCTAISMVARAQKKDLHATALSINSFGNKTFSLDISGYIGIIAMILAIIMLVLIFVVRKRLIRANIAKTTEVRYY